MVCMFYLWTVQRSFDTKSQFSCVGLCVRLYNASSIVLFDPWASRGSHEVPYPSISPLSLATTGRAQSGVTQRGPPASSSGPHEIHTAQIQMTEITL